MTDAQRERYTLALKQLHISQQTTNDMIAGYPPPDEASDWRMIYEIEDLSRRMDALTAIWQLPY